MHGDRKTVSGLWKEWTPKEARPILGDYLVPPHARIISEDVAIVGFNELLNAKGVIRTTSATEIIQEKD